MSVQISRAVKTITNRIPVLAVALWVSEGGAPGVSAPLGEPPGTFLDATGGSGVSSTFEAFSVGIGGIDGGWALNFWSNWSRAPIGTACM